MASAATKAALKKMNPVINKAFPSALTTEREGKTCVACVPQNAFRPLTDFYASSSPLHADGLVPMCKECILKYGFDFTTGNLDIEGFNAVLRQIDRPFIPALLQAANREFDELYDLTKVREKVRLENRFKLVQIYFKLLLASPQYRKWRWADGQEYRREDTVAAKEAVSKEKKSVTAEMKKFWGDGMFTPQECLMLQESYDKWVTSLNGEPEEQAQIETIKNLCYMNLQIVRGVANGDNVSNMMTAYNNLLAIGNLKPKDKNAGENKLTPLGCRIRDMMEYAPADFFADKMMHHDAQHYEEYIDRFIKRPMRNTMLNEKVEDKEFTVTTDDNDE